MLAQLLCNFPCSCVYSVDRARKFYVALGLLHDQACMFSGVFWNSIFQVVNSSHGFRRGDPWFESCNSITIVTYHVCMLNWNVVYTFSLEIH